LAVQCRVWLAYFHWRGLLGETQVRETGPARIWREPSMAAMEAPYRRRCLWKQPRRDAASLCGTAEGGGRAVVEADARRSRRHG